MRTYVDNSLHSLGPDLPFGDLITTSWVEFTEPATTSTAAYATEKLPVNSVELRKVGFQALLSKEYHSKWGSI
jgi:hypothetical protein